MLRRRKKGCHSISRALGSDETQDPGPGGCGVRGRPERIRLRGGVAPVGGLFAAFAAPLTAVPEVALDGPGPGKLRPVSTHLGNSPRKGAS